MDDLNIKINDDISKDLLNMNLTDMFCKHVIRRNPDGIQIKAGKLYIESCKIGYKVCNWSFPNKRILETIHETPACVKGITIEYYIF